MEPSAFPSNSKLPPKQAAAPKKPEIKKVISGEAKVGKKPLLRRWLETFTFEHNKAVATFVYSDIVVPQIKALVMDMFTNGLRRKLYGEQVGYQQSGFSQFQQPGYTAYNRVQQIAPGLVPRPDPTQQQGGFGRGARGSFDFRYITIPTRAEAQAVLDELAQVVAEYGVASVGDFYGMCGIVPDFTDERYGWVNLAGSNVSPTPDGRYVINLPRPDVIE